MLAGAFLLVFGGCCSNLLFLEQLLKQNSDIGDVLTFAQFLAITIEGIIYYSVRNRRLPEVRKWLVPSFLYFAVSILNNKVWKFNVSVQMHSIFRSSNSLVVMLVGLCAGRRFSGHQMAAVGIITAAVVAATLRKPSEGSTLGFFMLLLASLLSAFQSLYVEKMQTSGREMMLMLHLCSLPYFVFFQKQIQDQWSRITNLKLLLANCLTQWVCVAGVNQLAPAGALTTSVVLTLRKFVSLVLSGYLFNQFSYTLFICGIIVSVGAIYYAKAPRVPNQLKMKQS
ncbi:UDP-N-acetylglucosamine transporter yea4 [Wickerhamiella sorbophila]|uniref:UDP-N-acetylglucosamine transporter yea4 n=1 Tax=Wickerhamiella sorbophila TaxID=45607 RepID=A0A2T0FDG2_9ASCO|nr:UDP-N-acetylglucosamine transporter yea4 [Wickerhamiella sorbophila]PRT52979.1 UDP-N-acetylglucosamine transporter yea4 [Wickerhamiella sorbophila]